MGCCCRCVHVHMYVMYICMYMFEIEQKKIKRSLISLHWPESQGSKMPNNTLSIQRYIYFKSKWRAEFRFVLLWQNQFITNHQKLFNWTHETALVLKREITEDLLRWTHELPVDDLFTKGLLWQYCSYRREKYKKLFFWEQTCWCFLYKSMFWDIFDQKLSCFHGFVSSLSTIYTCLQKLLTGLTSADRFWVLQMKLGSVGYSIHLPTHTHTHIH